MKLFKEYSPKLECGCEIGRHLCEDAEYLWSEVQRTYEAYSGGTGTRAGYERALRAYNDHYKGEREDLPA